MMPRAVDRLASRLMMAWRFTWGHAFPMRGAPDWLLAELARAVADERTLREGHELLMSKVHKERGEQTPEQMLQAFRPEAHGGEFPAGDGLADYAITGLRQAAAGQAMHGEEPSDLRAAAMRCRAGVLEVPMGKIKTFGPLGPQYEVGGPLRQLDDGDWLIEVTLVADGRREEYRLSKVLEDQDAR